MDEVKITVLTGTGDFFSVCSKTLSLCGHYAVPLVDAVSLSVQAGADVKAARTSFDDEEARVSSSFPLEI